jgi:hypothetical protein
VLVSFFPESFEDDRFIKGLNEGPLKAPGFFYPLFEVLFVPEVIGVY